MGSINWKELLGWNSEQLDELRLTGFIFLREGQYPKALLFFKALSLIDPSSAYDKQTLGALYVQMGLGEEALPALEEALALDPSHEPTLLNRVKALLLQQRKEEALALARALQKSEDISISGDATALVAAYS